VLSKSIENTHKAGDSADHQKNVPTPGRKDFHDP